MCNWGRMGVGGGGELVKDRIELKLQFPKLYSRPEILAITNKIPEVSCGFLADLFVNSRKYKKTCTKKTNKCFPLKISSVNVEKSLMENFIFCVVKKYC